MHFITRRWRPRNHYTNGQGSLICALGLAGRPFRPTAGDLNLILAYVTHSQSLRKIREPNAQTCIIFERMTHVLFTTVIRFEIVRLTSLYPLFLSKSFFAYYTSAHISGSYADPRGHELRTFEVGSLSPLHSGPPIVSSSAKRRAGIGLRSEMMRPGFPRSFSSFH